MAVTPDGKGGFKFQPQAFNYVLGKDGWKVPQTGAAELIRVSWLEVTASTVDLKPGKKYEVSFKVSLTTDAFGWDNNPVFLMAKIGKRGKFIWKKVLLTERVVSDNIFKVPQSDNLIIQVPTDSNDTKLYFGLYEVWGGNWKRGLKIHEATVQRLPDNS